MKQLIEILDTEFQAQLADSFKKCAYYEPVMDYVEYIAEDTITVSDRIDQWLTLIYAADSRNIVGFRLKGFRHLFNRIKVILKLRDEHFVLLAEALEAAVSELGEEVCKNQEKFNSYKIAVQFAREHKVKFENIELLAA